MYYHSLYYEDMREAETVYQWLQRNVQTLDLELRPPDDVGLAEIRFITEDTLVERVATHLTALKSTGQYALDIAG